MKRKITYKQKPTQDLAEIQHYKFGNTEFNVCPIFKNKGERTLSSVLFKLMQNEIDNS